MNATIARIRRLTADPLPAGDGPLLDAFLAGDQAAFAALVRRHAGPVFATCRRVLRHQQDAEDAFQATFLVLARRAAAVWPREAVGAWLFGVAHRVALKARAVQCRRAGRELPLEEVAGAERPAPDFDLADAVHRAVLKLPEVYRAAVVACDLEGLSRKEAAERLGWTEGTLSGRLARARQLLATRLRRSGLSLPAGLVALATTDIASAATVQTTIDLATGTAATAPAAVAALTEGVVRSMALIKLKAMAAAVFAACALGFGAFAATGAGEGDGAGGQPSQTQGQGAPPAAKPSVPPAAPGARPEAPALKEPQIDLAREELEALILDIQSKVATGDLAPQYLDLFRMRQSNIDQLLAPNLDPQRRAKAQIERDRLQGTWGVRTLTVGGKTIPTDAGKWVIEVASRTIRMPYSEGDGKWKHREFEFTLDETPASRTINLHAPFSAVVRGVYEFTLSSEACVKCHRAVSPRPWEGPLPDPTVVCLPGVKAANATKLGLRLALSIDGKRPAKFGGEGVIVFELVRPAEEKAAREPPEPKPTDARVATYALAVARAQLAEAEAELNIARAGAAKAQAVAEQHTRQLDLARERLEAAEKAAADLKKPSPGVPVKEGDVFTVHVRTLTDAERVIRVKLTGDQTVLDAFVHATAVGIKATEVSAWVVRGDTILPVDLTGITKHGDTKTNYQLLAGDRLFVQAKPAK